MEPRHTYISYAYISIISTAYFDHRFVFHIDNMNYSDILESYTLQDNKVLQRGLVLKNVQRVTHFPLLSSCQIVFFCVCPIWIDLGGKANLAEFTLDGFPAVSDDLVAIFLGPLGV